MHNTRYSNDKISVVADTGFGSAGGAGVTGKLAFMKAPLFRKEAVESRKDALLGVVVLRQPLALQFYTLLGVAAVAGIVLLLTLGQYTRRETASGMVVGASGEVRIQAQLTGTIEQWFAEEGRQVVKGEPLALISKAPTSSGALDVDAELLARAKSTLAELDEKVKGEQAVHRIETDRLGLQRDLAAQQVKSLAVELAQEKERLGLVESRLRDYERLAASNTASASQVRDQRQATIDARSKLESLQREWASQVASERDLTLQLAQRPSLLASRMADYAAQRIDLERRVLEIQSRQRLTVTAPVDGILTAVQSRKGQSVSAQTVLATLVQPATEFEAEVYVPTRAIGFIRTGQSVNLRYHAFPHQRFGIYEGTVRSVAKTILSPQDIVSQVPLQNEPYYRVVIAINESSVRAYGEAFPLQSGMLLDADIVLDRRPLWQWLLDPVFSLRGRFSA